VDRRNAAAVAFITVRSFAAGLLRGFSLHPDCGGSSGGNARHGGRRIPTRI